MKTLTTKEIEALKSCGSEEDWNRVATAIKEREPDAGQYPVDWYEKVIAGGIMDRFLGGGLTIVHAYETEDGHRHIDIVGDGKKNSEQSTVNSEQ